MTDPSEPLSKSLTTNEVLDVLSANQLVISKSIHGSKQYQNLTTKLKNLKTGDIYIAYHGVNFDSHDNIMLAIEEKASLIILEDETWIKSNADSLKNISWILVKNSRKAWAILADCRFGFPSQRFKYIGITGTNGKTSTGWYLFQLFKTLKIPCLFIGTLGYLTDAHNLVNNLTTPDPDQLYKILANHLKRKTEYVFIEVSSHALVQNKLAPIKFDSIGFTSFSQDHLDFHKSMENYANSKLLIFNSLKENAAAFVAFQVKLEMEKLGISIPNNCNTVGFDPNANIELIESEKSYHFQSKAIEKTQSAHSNISIGNLAIACLTAEAVLKKTIDSNLLQTLPPPPGRFQNVPSPKGASSFPMVYVDYAHTPQALELTLKHAKSLTNAKLILTFGCGGNRDRSKRSIMGAIANSYADLIILTNDNPRGENPHKIVEDILSFTPEQNTDRFVIQLDRNLAIKLAIQRATANDVVLICGKGHETHQEMKSNSIEFNDFLVAEKHLREKNAHKY